MCAETFLLYSFKLYSNFHSSFLVLSSILFRLGICQDCNTWNISRQIFWWWGDMITTFTRLNIVKEMFSLHFYYDCFYTARLRVYYMLNPVECRKRTFAGLKIWSAVEHIERARLSKLICAFALLRSISTLFYYWWKHFVE